MAFRTTQEFGVTMFPTDYSIQPVELAQAVEERGLDSLFFQSTPTFRHPEQRRSQGAAIFQKCTGTLMILSSHLVPAQP